MSAQLTMFPLDLIAEARKPSKRRDHGVVRLPQLDLPIRQLPATRQDCQREIQTREMGACPWLTCRHHLWHERAEEFSALLDSPPAVWPHTCSLDVADAVAAALPGADIPGVGTVTLSKSSAERALLSKAWVGAHMGLSGERARQLEQSGLEHLRRRPLMAELEGKVDSAVDWYGGE